MPTAPSPVLPNFTDGTLVRQGDLNALSTNLNNLYSYNQGGFRTQRDCVIAQQTTSQSIANSVDTLVNFQSATVNTNNMWIGSQATQITIQTAGLYWVFGQIRYPSIGAGGFNLIYSGSILVNGTAFANAVATMAAIAPTTGSAGCTVGALVNLAAGATVYFNAFQSTGAPQSLPTNGGGTFIGAVFLTPSA